MSSFDTLELANALESSGMDRKLAEGQARAIRDHVVKDLVSTNELKHELSIQLNKILIAFGAINAALFGLLKT